MATYLNIYYFPEFDPTQTLSDIGGIPTDSNSDTGMKMVNVNPTFFLAPGDQDQPLLCCIKTQGVPFSINTTTTAIAATVLPAHLVNGILIGGRPIHAPK